MKFFLLTLCFCCINSTAEVVFKKIEHPKKIALVKIINRIANEEEIKFDNLLKKLKDEGYQIKNNAIIINTRGGNVHAAQSIGKIIREQRLNTFLAQDAVCGSSCVLALIGGVVRNVYGQVTVHRPSFNDSVPLEKVRKYTYRTDENLYRHIYEMGISHLLTDAILTTPHWASRELTDTELRRWSINSTDRIYEEIYMRSLAIESKTSIDDVQSLFSELKKQCEIKVKNFEIELWSCFRLKYLSKLNNADENEINFQPKFYLIKNINYFNKMDLFKPIKTDYWHGKIKWNI